MVSLPDGNDYLRTLFGSSLKIASLSGTKNSVATTSANPSATIEQEVAAEQGSAVKQEATVEQMDANDQIPVDEPVRAATPDAPAIVESTREAFPVTLATNEAQDENRPLILEKSRDTSPASEAPAPKRARREESHTTRNNARRRPLSRTLRRAAAPSRTNAYLSADPGFSTSHPRRRRVSKHLREIFGDNFNE